MDTLPSGCLPAVHQLSSFLGCLRRFQLRARLGSRLSAHPGQRGITPTFGYSAPYPSASGTPTHLIWALPSTQYARVRLLPAVPPPLSSYLPFGDPGATRRGNGEASQVSTLSVHACLGSRTPRSPPEPHRTGLSGVAFDTADSLGTPNPIYFVAQYPCPHAPLPTLRPFPRGSDRTARGEVWIGYFLYHGGLPPPVLGQLAGRTTSVIYRPVQTEGNQEVLVETASGSKPFGEIREPSRGPATIALPGAAISRYRRRSTGLHGARVCGRPGGVPSLETRAGRLRRAGRRHLYLWASAPRRRHA